jgi:uncharacterized protein YecT (DUF1311 family)
MPSTRALVRKLNILYVLPIAVLSLLSMASANAQESSPPPQPQSQSPQPPVSNYDESIFLKPIPNDQLTFLSQFSGALATDLIQDKQFHKLMKSFVPDCMFHYGSDMPLSEALDMVFKNSHLPVLVRYNRYVVVSGRNGPYLGGRAFLWIDMQEGIALGGFFFHPTNGEPTPSVVIFSRQVKEKFLSMSELPPAFAEDLTQWSQESRVPFITTRYFITGSNKRLLLEHDEDYCATVDGNVPLPDNGCGQWNADAADIDMTAASYLDQTHYATNATAWMLDPEQVAWIQVRDTTCRSGPDPLGCHIHMTHERTHLIIKRPTPPHPPMTSHPSHK